MFDDLIFEKKPILKKKETLGGSVNPTKKSVNPSAKAPKTSTPDTSSYNPSTLGYDEDYDMPTAYSEEDNGSKCEGGCGVCDNGKAMPSYNGIYLDMLSKIDALTLKYERRLAKKKKPFKLRSRNKVDLSSVFGMK